MEDKKRVGAGFPNDATIVRAVYDFSKDGGAVGKLDVLEADSKCIVSMKHAHVLTAVTSTGDIEVSLGSESEGDEFLDGALKAALTIGDVLEGEGEKVLLTEGDKVELDIAESAATAGKIEFVFEVIKAN